MRIKSHYYFVLLILSTFMSVFTLIYLLTHDNSKVTHSVDCIYHNDSKIPIENINKTLIEVWDSSNAINMFLNNIYHNSSQLFIKTLTSIKSFREVFDKINERIISNTHETKPLSIEINFDYLKNINEIYGNLVNYINEFRQIINEIEIVKNFFNSK